MVRKILIAFLIGGIGGWIFSLVHTPIPWTLGPLVSIAIAKMGFKREIYWPGQIRNIGMVILGYMMGRSFTPETGYEILTLFPILVIVTLVNVGISLLAGLIIGRFTGLSLATSFFGSLPAGLNQTTTICEDIEGADVGAITLMQTIRVLTVVFTVPFLAFHALSDKVDRVLTVANQFDLYDFGSLVIYFLVIAIILVVVGKFLKMTGALFTILPLVITAVFVLSGMDAPPLPSGIVKLAQIFVGIRIGSSINISTLTNWKRIAIFSFLSILGILVVFSGIDLLLTRIAPITFLTAFISTAPGGMAEMGLTAMMLQADLSTVIAFQLFRLMFVLLVAIPAVRWGLIQYRRRQTREFHT